MLKDLRHMFFFFKVLVNIKISHFLEELKIKKKAKKNSFCPNNEKKIHFFFV